jgi:hypothetical protein
VTGVVDATAAVADTPDTVFIPDPSSLTVPALQGLAASPASLVLVAPGPRELQAVGAPISPVDDVSDETPQPACGLRAATVAGSIRFSGLVYAGGAEGCYHAGNGAGLVTARRGNGAETIVLGSASTLSNAHLGDEGDAALGLELLGGGPRLAWVLPQPPSHRAADAQRRGLLDLLPERLLWALLELFVAVVLLALWRARHLGPVIREPLPVVVRAVETVEGRARLLRAARARGTAAELLRGASRERLRGFLRLPTDAGEEAVVDATARRAGRKAMDVHALLYGAVPASDAALVDLAAALDALEDDVRKS